MFAGLRAACRGVALRRLIAPTAVRSANLRARADRRGFGHDTW